MKNDFFEDNMINDSVSDNLTPSGLPEGVSFSRPNSPEEENVPTSNNTEGENVPTPNSPEKENVPTSNNTEGERSLAPDTSEERRIEALNRLSEKEAEEAEELLLICAQKDGTLFSIDYSSESNMLPEENCLFICREQKTGRLTGLCYAFIPDEYTAELTIAVHPDFRRWGIMTELLDYAEDSLYEAGIDTFYYVGHGTEEEKRIAEHMELEESSEELLMELPEKAVEFYRNKQKTLENGLSGATKNTVRKERATGTENPVRPEIALCNAEAVVSNGTICICNVYVPENLRRKGLGRCVTENAICEALLSDSELKHVILQVSGDNIPAVNLYKSMGFEVTARTVYYC